MTKVSTGASVVRSEDERLVRGEGCYLDDIDLPACAVMMFFRSPYASGRITELDLTDARDVSGVLAIYTAADLAAAGVKDLPASPVPASKKHPGRASIAQPVLAKTFVRYVGEPVAAVVAESKAAARDALELVMFDVDESVPASDIAAALAADASLVHEDAPGNVLGVLEQGDEDATNKAFADADQIIQLDIVNNRLAPSAMEPRGCAASFDTDTGEYTLYQGCQGVHSLRDRITQSLPVEADKLHVICPDVGGGFGLKMFLQCETINVLHATATLGRPVKWVAERGESFLSDLHGRDHLTHAELAVTERGDFLAMRVHINSNVGAYQSQAGALIAWLGAYMTTGCYRIASCYTSVQLVMTNTVPVDAYRGAGRPEALYLIERLVDKAARELKLLPDAIRRRNFIPKDAFPYRVPTGQVYDSGDYVTLMDQCLERADWRGFPARKDDAERRGKLAGIGLAYYVEICSAYGGERTHLEVTPEGRLTARVGTQSTGQGHETSYAQIISGKLGIALDLIDVKQGDTRIIPTGEGTGGSRSMAIGGSSLSTTAGAMLEQGRMLAAAMLSEPLDQVEAVDGCYVSRVSGQQVSIADVARESHARDALPDGVQKGLASSESFTPEAGTFPNGCHVCEVEVDSLTGTVEIVRYTVQDDVGNVINPLLLQGQIMGGVAQGLGQAMMERAVYEPESGQLLSASFLDYAMPFAADMPDLDYAMTPVPSPRNPLGVKGAGEAGTIGAPPALVNAVVDALSEFGIEHIDMPVTPMAVWQALTGSIAKEKREAA
ncbi:MAG: xanthine dehydrogenase family protein molybdopterin-binding subunit [Pseudomonadota bacterium]